MEEVLLWCRMFHNVLHWRCKTHSGYVFCRDKPRHKCGDFIPECCYKMDQWPLTLVVVLEKPGMRRGRKSLQCHSQPRDWRKGSAQCRQPSFQQECNQKYWLYFTAQGRGYHRKRETYIQMYFMCFDRRNYGQTVICACIGMKLP